MKGPRLLTRLLPWIQLLCDQRANACGALSCEGEMWGPGPRDRHGSGGEMLTPNRLHQSQWEQHVLNRAEGSWAGAWGEQGGGVPRTIVSI